MRLQSLLGALAVSILIAAAAKAQVSSEEQPAQTGSKPMSQEELFKKMAGKWEGTCRTWFEPGKLADESKVAGEIKSVLNGKFLRHTYEGKMQGKPRRGEDTIAYNHVTKNFQSSWFDDFHMSYAIMFSEGEAVEQGFSVRGDYAIAPDQEPWGWRTEYKLIDDDHLTITAYNIHPTEGEAKAVETVYQRVKQAAQDDE